MKSYLLASFLLIGFVTSPVQACINKYHLKPVDVEKSYKQSLDRYAKKYRAEVKNKSLSKETLNDYGVLLILNRDYKAAIDIFTKLETRFPNIAMTAANLGTAYELNGDSLKALTWIKKGVERDHNEHDGTEWLHVKILEAKLAMLNDKDWLARHNVVGLPIDVFNKKHIARYASNKDALNKLKNNLTVTDFLGKTHNVYDIEKAIIYQTAERRKFIKPPNAIMADLYHSESVIHDLEVETDASEYRDFFNISNEQAEAYAPKNSAIYKKVHGQLDFESTEKADNPVNNNKDTQSHLAILFMLVSLISAVLYLSIRFRKNKKA